MKTHAPGPVIETKSPMPAGPAHRAAAKGLDAARARTSFAGRAAKAAPSKTACYTGYEDLVAAAKSTAPRDPPATSPSRPDKGGAPAKCGCDGAKGGCAKCAESGRDDPKKAVDIQEDDFSEKPRPYAGGAATIQCDGKGGWELLLNSYASATCGTKGCVTAHENSHIADWKAKWPNGCNNQPRGYLPKGDPPDVPLMTVAEYNAFLKDSECRAHTVDLNCANALPKEGGCKKTVEDYINLTTNQRKVWC